mmetsp:Transcript_65782/g.176248  ORF Transcript_65782/g.176248 Transcript_65782/m.176248 type:complete len:289 (+) Transcript_65782:198-1064(+)
MSGTRAALNNTRTGTTFEEMSHMCDYQFNVIVVGDSGVGKSDVMQRFVKNSEARTVTHKIIDLKMRKVNIGGKVVKMHVWDASGSEQHQHSTSIYYRLAMGVVIVFDMTNAESFANVGRWMQRVEQHGRPDVKITLIGNKCDSADKVNHMERHPFIHNSKQTAPYNVLWPHTSRPHPPAPVPPSRQSQNLADASPFRPSTRRRCGATRTAWASPSSRRRPRRASTWSRPSRRWRRSSRRSTSPRRRLRSARGRRGTRGCARRTGWTGGKVCAVRVVEWRRRGALQGVS